MGGPLVLERAKPGQIVPVDSEHSALAQCLRGGTRRGGTPARADRVGRAVPRPHPRRAARRDRRRGAGPPDLGHGAGRHDQLRQPGQQGPRGDRGPPALRHPLRPDRGRGPPDARGALDGRVRRRLDARAGQPADDADPDRARPGLARPGARRRPAGRLDPGQHLGVLPARRRGVPGRRAWPAGRGSGAAPRRRSTTRPTRSRSRRSGRDGSGSWRSSTRSPTCSGSTTYPRRRH